MRIRLTELMAETGASPIEVARVMWPYATDQTRRVLIGKWINGPTVSIRLDQLKALSEFFSTTNINRLIEADETTTN